MKIYRKAFSYIRGILSTGPLSSFNGFSGLKLLQFTKPTASMKYFVKDGFGKNPFVFMVVNKIAKVTSRLPFELQDSKGNVIEEGRLYELLKKPNPEQYTDAFLYNIIAELENTGNAFIHGLTAFGFEGYSELTVFQSKNTEIKVNQLDEVTGYLVTKYGKQIFYKADEVLHLKFANIVHEDIDVKYGFSPLEAAIMVNKSSNDVFEAEASIFENKGATGVLTNGSDVPMLEKDQTKVQENWEKKTAGSGKFGKILITNSKLKYEAIGMSPSDLKLIEQSISKLRIICSIYEMPSVIFNDPLNRSYNNMSEANKTAYIDVYIPLFEMIANALNEWLIKDSYKSDEKIVLNKDLIEVLKTVNTELSKKVIEEFKAGLISREEARNLLEHKK